MKPKLIPYFDSALSKAASRIAHQGSAAVLRRCILTHLLLFSMIHTHSAASSCLSTITNYVVSLDEVNSSSMHGYLAILLREF